MANGMVKVYSYQVHGEARGIPFAKVASPFELFLAPGLELQGYMYNDQG